MSLFSKKTIKQQAFIAALKQVRLHKNETIYLQTDFSKFGTIEGCHTKDSFCQFILDAIFSLIGSEGTIVVPSYTTQVARYDLEYNVQKTPSVCGIFSEHVRRLKGAVRSLHPLHSFCSIGKNSGTICCNNGANDFGVESPFDRLHKLNASILTIGLESGYVVGNVHYMETMYAVPYQYNKLLKWKPIYMGKKIKREFFASVRHLNLKTVHDLSFLATHANKQKLILKSNVARNEIFKTNFSSIYNLGISLLKKNPYCFLKQKPDFKFGKIPFDGATQGKDGISLRKKTKNPINWSGYYLNNRSFAGAVNE